MAQQSQSPEAIAFLNRLSSIPLAPGESVDSAIKLALDDEAALRRLFATQKDDPRLKDPIVGLVDVYGPNTDHIRTIRERVVKDGDDLSKHYIMPLPEEQRRKHGQPSMAPSFEDFRARWNIFSEGSLSSLTDWSNIIAAGGSVLACLAPLPAKVIEQGSKRAIRKYYHSEAFPTSDVDLFIYGLTPEQAEVKAIAIYEAVRDSVPWEVTTVRAKNAVSIHCQYPYRPVQIVLRIYQSPAEILAGFDVDSSCFAYDGQRVLATPRAIMALLTQSNQVAMDRRSPSYEVRLAKYAARGFEIHVPDLHREDFDPTIFERALSRVEGLARLLVLEKMSQPDHREAFLTSRRYARGRPSQGWSRRAQRRARRLTGDLKTQAEFGGLQMNDYDVLFHVPYGPGFDARKIEKLVYQTDLGMNSTFNPKNKDRRLHRHPAFFGTMAECLEDCCEYCPSPLDDEEKELQVKEDEQYIRGRVTFLQEDPGRQSITGSFNPIDSGEWSEQAYVRPIQKLFTAISEHNRQAVLEYIKRNTAATAVTTRDHLGRSPLQFALMCGAEDIAIDLIDNGARMTSRLVDGRTSLHLACAMDMDRAVKKMLEVSEKNKKEAEEKERLLKEKDGKEGEGDRDAEGDNDGDIKMEKEERVRDSSEDDWTSEDIDMSDPDDDEDGSKKKKKEEDQSAVLASDEDALDENPDEPDVLELDAPDWDQCLTPLGYAIITGSLAIIDLLIAAGVYVKSPQKPKTPSNMSDSGTQSFHPLRLTSITPDTAVACHITEKLVKAGAISSAADDTMTTVFHRLVWANKLELVETLLRVDSTTKVATRFMATSGWNNVIHPITTAVGNNKGGMAMVALLMSFGGCKLVVTKEDFDRSMAAHPNGPNQLSGSDSAEQYLTSVLQPLEASIASRNDIYQLIVDTVDAEVVKRAVFKEACYYSGSYRRSLLEYVQGAIKSLKRDIATHKRTAKREDRKLASQAPVADEVQAPTEPRKAVTQPTWDATYTELELLVAQRTAKNDNVSASTRQARDGALDNADRLGKVLEYHCQVLAVLEERGAQKWNEIFPDKLTEYNEREYQPDNDEEESKPVEDKPTVKKYVKITKGWNNREQGDYLIPQYDELYEAVWQGDHKKMRELCLPMEDGSNSSRDLIQMAVSLKTNDSNIYMPGYTPLFVALQARRWDTAKEVLEIAQAQYFEEEETEVKKKDFSRIGISLHDSDDEDEDSDAESDQSGATPKLGFDNIADRFHVKVVHSDVEASSLFDQSPSVFINGENIRADPIAKTINERDAEAFVQVCELMASLRKPRSLPDSALVDIIRLDDPALLDEYIRRTGQGISVKNDKTDKIDEEEKEEAKESQREESANQEAESEDGEYKLYLGLNVHGVKRKDLAQKGDPNAVYQSADPQDVLPLWTASGLGSLKIMDYLNSSSVLEAYNHYIATYPSTKRAKELRTIDDLEKELPKLLGFLPNPANESAVLAASVLQGSANLKGLASMKKLMAISPRPTADAINLAVRVKHITPLLAICAVQGSPQTFDWLVANGANVQARDEKGWNIYHFLCAYPEADLALLKHALSKIPAQTTEALMSQQSHGKKNTPFIIAVKAGNINIVTLLLETQLQAILPTLQMRDVQGSTPLHCAIYKAFSTLVGLLVKHSPPESLYVENGVGATPLEITSLAHLTDNLRNDFPGGGSVAPSNLSAFTSSVYADPQPPGIATIEDGERDAAGLRAVVDKAKTTRVLANKPTILEALVAHTDRVEQNLTNWKTAKAEEEAAKEAKKAETTNQTVASVRFDTRNVVKTYEIFSGAVVRVPKRTLVHLEDVQKVVLSAVETNKPAGGWKEDDGGLESDDEEGEVEKYWVLGSVNWARSVDEF